MRTTILFSVFLVLLSSCDFRPATVNAVFRPTYRLNFAPPSDNAQPMEIFPKEIDGQRARLVIPKIGGMEVHYGKSKVIYAVRLNSSKEALGFFKAHLMKEFEKYPEFFTDDTNGKFIAEAYSDENEHTLGWINGRYVFAIKGNTRADFNTLIDKFKYIAH